MRTDRVTWGQIPSRDSPALGLIGWLEIPGQLAVHVRRLETIQIFLNGIPVPASGLAQPVRCLQLIPHRPPDEHTPRLIQRIPAFPLADAPLLEPPLPGRGFLSAGRADLDHGISTDDEPFRFRVQPGPLWRRPERGGSELYVVEIGVEQ